MNSAKYFLILALLLGITNTNLGAGTKRHHNAQQAAFDEVADAGLPQGHHNNVIEQEMAQQNQPIENDPFDHDDENNEPNIPVHVQQMVHTLAHGIAHLAQNQAHNNPPLTPQHPNHNQEPQTPPHAPAHPHAIHYALNDIDTP